MKADLHLHTTASDGAKTPSEVVKWAKEKGIEIMSVTDHDTVSGISEAAAAARGAGVKFVAGIEISTYSNCEIHILGYGIDYLNPEFLQELNMVKNQRKYRNVKIGERLKELGVELDYDFAAEGVGRMNIARQMIAQGYAKDANDAFERFLGTGAKAYVTVKRMTPVEAVKLLKKYGALCSVAHPKKLHSERKLDMLTAGLRPFGLNGLEVNYPGHSEQDKSDFSALLAKYNLYPTGGSDFHGDEDKDFVYDLDARTQKLLEKYLI
jgi:predicted metal-dependent phosphoesterase TrpH